MVVQLATSVSNVAVVEPHSPSVILISDILLEYITKQRQGELEVSKQELTDEETKVT